MVVSHELSHLQSSSASPSPFSMAKNNNNGRAKAYSIVGDGFLFAGGVCFVVLLLLWSLFSFFSQTPNTPPNFPKSIDQTKITSKKTTTTTTTLSDDNDKCTASGFDQTHDPPDPNFYDDPELSYTIDKPIKKWDDKRRAWLKQHPSFAAGAGDRILVVTGSQATPCKNSIGDHLLLKLFKNKVDYCRIHGHDIFYNTVLLQPKMFSFWAKVPTIRAVMLAHPEVEWIWWVDSDAAFTDMDFKLPLDRYKDYNMVIHGWPKLIYEEKSWTSINAGVFLIRNSQWAMDFMDVWASMGPQTEEYDKWGEIQRTTFRDKDLPESDDQTGLAYLLLKEKEKWGKKIYVESEYYFEGYWMEIVGTLENITEKYREIERGAAEAGLGLRRRHAEKVSEKYGELWKEYLKDAGYGRGSWRRPFITHFTGCQPCSGKHNQMYSEEACWEGMQKALNFADNQVLRKFGFVHKDLLDASTVLPLPFDYPA